MSQAVVHMLRVQCECEQEELLSYQMWQFGATGVESRDSATLLRPEMEGICVVAYFDDAETMQSAHKVLSAEYHCELESQEGDAWRDAWKDYFKPELIGQSMWIVPTWEHIRPAPGQMVLRIDPGRAFGSGTHETTRLIMQALLRDESDAKSVLDLGCGTGILGVTSLLRGALRVLAIDNDDVAVDVTKQTAQLNGFADKVSASTVDIRLLEGQFDRVLANIRTKVLLAYADSIVERMHQDSWLYLSGVLVEEQAEVEACYEKLGLVLVERTQLNDWVMLKMAHAKQGV